MRGAFLDNKVTYPCGDRIDVVDIKVQAKGIVLDVFGPTRRMGQVQVPTTTVRQDAVLAIIADHVEAEPLVKGLAGVEVARGYDCNRSMIHGQDLHADVRALGLAHTELVGERKSCLDRPKRTVATKSPERAALGVANKAAKAYDLGMQMRRPVDHQRVLRTRAAILAAFGRLVLERRYEAIRIADLVAEAGVGKATFYEHFRSKSDVLVAAMDPVLLAFSTAASGRAARSYVEGMVSHLWERRSMGRTIFNSVTTPIIQRRLAELVLLHIERADSPGAAPSIRAVGIAAAQIAIIRSWLAGEASCSAHEITDRMIDCSKLIA